MSRVLTRWLSVPRRTNWQNEYEYEYNVVGRVKLAAWRPLRVPRPLGCTLRVQAHSRSLRIHFTAEFAPFFHFYIRKVNLYSPKITSGGTPLLLYSHDGNNLIIREDVCCALFMREFLPIKSSQQTVKTDIFIRYLFSNFRPFKKVLIYSTEISSARIFKFSLKVRKFLHRNQFEVKVRKRVPY